MNPADILVVGVGGGGSRVVDRLADGIAHGPAFAVVDTDARTVASVSVPARLQAGAVVTDGLGAGGDIERGRRALEEDVEKVRNLVAGKSLVIIVACLGGGTGSSGAGVVSRAAQETGAVTLCFATQPFSFEGAARGSAAQKAAAAIDDAVDILVLVPNDRLTEATGSVKLNDAFDRANRVLTSGIAAMWKLLTQPGYINIGLADVRQAAGRAGGCGFGYAEGEGDGKAARVVEELLASPLLGGGAALERAGSLLVSIVGGPDMTLQDVGTVMDAISSRAPGHPNISMGTVLDEAWQNRLGILVLHSSAARRTGASSSAPSPPGGKGRRGRRARKATHTQIDLRFDSDAKGRFRNVEPTILDGEDLDIPTFLRRGIEIEK